MKLRNSFVYIAETKEVVPLTPELSFILREKITAQLFESLCDLLIARTEQNKRLSKKQSSLSKII